MLYTHSICSFFHYNAHFFIYLINYMFMSTHLLFLSQNNHYICIASILNVNFLSKHIMLWIPKSWKENAFAICHFIAIIELIMRSCLHVSMAYNNVSFPPKILFQMHLHTDWMSHTTKKYSLTHLTKVHSFTIGRNIRSISNMISIISQPFLLADRTRNAWRRS